MFSLPGFGPNGTGCMIVSEFKDLRGGLAAPLLRTLGIVTDLPRGLGLGRGLAARMRAGELFLDVVDVEGKSENDGALLCADADLSLGLGLASPSPS